MSMWVNSQTFFLFFFEGKKWSGKCADFGVQSLWELCVSNRSGTPGQSRLSPLHLRRHAVPGLLCRQLPSQHHAAEDPGLPAVLQVGSNLFLLFLLFVFFWCYLKGRSPWVWCQEISEMFKCIGLNNYGVGTRDATSTLFTLCATGILFFDTGRSRMQQKKGARKKWKQAREDRKCSRDVDNSNSVCC